MLALLLALQAAAAPARTTVFENVNVIPMDRERVLRDHVVLVRDGVIAAVGPRGRVAIPRAARRIDGQGGYLLPGLSDFHVHVRLRDDLGAYLAYGVTAIADMGGPDRLRPVRDSIRRGLTVGPEVFIGRFMDGPGGSGGIVESVDAARNAVMRADSQGYDFLKLYNAITQEQFDAIMAEAKARRMTVLGHSVRAVGLEKGFAAGQAMVAHGEEYFYMDLRGRTDDAGMADAVAFTRRARAYVLPNLSAYEAMTLQWGKPEVLEAYLHRPEAQWLPKYWVDDWRSRDYVRRQGSIDARNAFLKRLTLALHRAGVPLLTGTDSPGIPGMYAGASIHDELRLLVEAGLSPFEALAAATRNAGEFAGKHFRAQDRYGTITAGQRADLVLVAGNPLQDIGALRQPMAVMTRGNYLDRGALDALLKRWSTSPLN